MVNEINPRNILSQAPAIPPYRIQEDELPCCPIYWLNRKQLLITISILAGIIIAAVIWIITASLLFANACVMTMPIMLATIILLSLLILSCVALKKTTPPAQPPIQVIPRRYPVITRRLPPKPPAPNLDFADCIERRDERRSKLGTQFYNHTTQSSFFIPYDTKKLPPQTPIAIHEPRSPMITSQSSEPELPITPIITIPEHRPQNSLELLAHIQNILSPNCWNKNFISVNAGISGEREHKKIGKVTIYLTGCNYTSLLPPCKGAQGSCTSLCSSLIASFDQRTLTIERDFGFLPIHYETTGLILMRDERILRENPISDADIDDPYHSSIMDPLLKREIFAQYQIDPELPPGQVRLYPINSDSSPYNRFTYPNLGCTQIADLMGSHQQTPTQSYQALYNMYREAINTLSQNVRRLVVLTPPFYFTIMERSALSTDGLDAVAEETLSEYMIQAAFLEALADVLGELENPRDRFNEGVVLIRNLYYTYEV